jgi:hypothetical protein
MDKRITPKSFLLCLLLVAFAPGCPISAKLQGASLSSSSLVGSGSGFEYFQSRVHPMLIQQCGSCHGSAVQPTFASSNVFSAYSVAKNGTAPASGRRLANFGSLEDSALWIESTSLHCGDSFLCGASTRRMNDFMEMLEGWKLAEQSSSHSGGGGNGGGNGGGGNGGGGNGGGGNGGGGNGGGGGGTGGENYPTECKLSNPITVPANLPDGSANSNSYVSLTFPFPAGAVPNVGGLNAFIEAQRYFDGYRFRAPRLTLTSGSVSFSGLLILLNDRWSTNEVTFRSIGSMVMSPPGSPAGTPLAGGIAIQVAGPNPPQDALRICLLP